MNQVAASGRARERAMASNLELQTMRKVAYRLVPIVGLAYLINVLDRFNISFAALTMNKELGLSATAYGLGAGAFFWSYVLFQVPANMILGRLGARRWIMIIMFWWGLCSASAALITDATSFVIVRFLLGMAEAGFFPGVAFFMTRWFPSRHRGKAMGVFFAVGASAGIIGGPIAANLLQLNGVLGIAGWRWIFLAEGLPAVALAIACPLLLRDHPSEASWLRAEECAWLERTLQEEQSVAHGAHLPFLKAIVSPAIVLLALIHLWIGCGVYGKAYFLPLMIKSLGFSNITVGYVTMIPAITGVLGMLIFSRRSDHTGERVWHLVVPCLDSPAGVPGCRPVGRLLRLGILSRPACDGAATTASRSCTGLPVAPLANPAGRRAVSRFPLTALMRLRLPSPNINLCSEGCC